MQTIGKVPSVQTAVAAAVVALAVMFGFMSCTPAAHAVGGNYVIVGGTPAERAQVRAALNISTFNWSLVAQTITITLSPNAITESTPGQISVATGLVTANSGRFGWGLIQHEYAHQVDFFLINQEEQASLLPLLGGETWMPVAGQSFWQAGAERFASMLTWSYWPSRDNADNTFKNGICNPSETCTTPPQFKTLLNEMLNL